MLKWITATAGLCMLSVRLTAQAPCTVPVNFFPTDTIMVCAAANYTLQAPAVTGMNLTWSSGQNTSSINIPFSGIYWLDISDGNCTVRDSVTILFNSFLLAPVTDDQLLCKKGPAGPLQVPGQNLLWYTAPTGGTGSPIAPVPVTTDTGRTEYWVSQTILGCESPRSMLTVKVIDKPFFELGNAFIIPCNTEGIVLQVIPAEQTIYNWSNGTHESSMLAGQRGKYWLYAENQCGNHSDTVVAVECHDKCVQTPTGFTPNRDGKNDQFKAACFCPVPEYYLTIYNRNGEQLFETRSPSAGWDGYFMGKAQPVGAYVYITRYYDFVLKRFMDEKGTFVLLR